MGKRKYFSQSEESAKRNKADSKSELPDNHDTAAGQPQNEKAIDLATKDIVKPTLFDIKYFRKELSGKQGQTMALTQFLQVCLNPDSEVDYMLEYLKVGGNSHEILRQIAPEYKKNLTLATPAFHIFHLIILKVQSSLPHMIAITEEASRYFLNTFIPTIEIMISENAGPRHRKIVLSLLTSMVTLNSDLGVEVLNQVPLTPKNLQHIVEKPNYKEKDNVRTAFVHFMTSFLVDGHLPLIKALLEKQGLLSLVIPGLVYDDADAVLMFLNILKKNVIDNNLISKTLKLKTFNHQVLHNMFKVFMWKGPTECKNEAREEIMLLLSEIIITLFTSHKLGLYFLDPLLGTSDANKNQNLFKALNTLKRPWENKDQCDTVLEIIFRCPDIHRAIINVIELNFQPQHSPAWVKTIDFFLMLLDKLKPENMIIKLKCLNPTQTANFIRFMTMPVPLLKLLNTGIGKDQTISLYCVKILVKMLQTLKRYMKLLELEDSSANILELKNKLDNFIPKHMPPVNIIASLLNNVIDDTAEDETSKDYRLPKPLKVDSLVSLLDLLLLYHYIHPPFCEPLEELVNTRKILEYSMTTSGNLTLFNFKFVSLWLYLDPSVLTYQNPMLKYLYVMILEVYISDKDDTWMEAKETLQLLFQNAKIFEGDEDEIHLILYTLRNSKVTSASLSSLSNALEYILGNIEELSEYMRNQLVNFEISDESNKAHLNKLFNDLMHNKNTGDSTFLDTKIPSPFIIGCIQYLESNKAAKKDLKSFLGLYVTNLLHYNYSPELTEMLIGDYKLNAKTYMADWRVKAVSIPVAISKDEILQNISKSIIDNEDISLTNIFPLLKSSLESDLEVMGVSYKIDISKAINGTDLFVWAKYLMFCIVRLTNMGILSDDQQKKILTYFEIIIELGKKCHMTNVCRNIILNLSRNSHFLKIFQPIDFNKSPCQILATQFLLHIIANNEDILNYYYKEKNFILRSYQQKTLNEITKAFIKINKRKNINSSLIIRVLYVIGLSKKDDLKVFDYIFTTNIETCFKEDKEPTFVLDLLSVLVEKYSKSVLLELSNDVLKKCIHLYYSLLTYKEVIPNLTSLEESLIKYFENKPHQIKQIDAEGFKKFFYANTVRKTTSHLALILIKYNSKLCDVFVEEINRAEILRLREITLPLGNGIISHSQFIVENKHALTKIYEEYKSNIKKFLEKPHKAGQVYINSSKLLRKLIIECMDEQDCQNIFAKSHKFEIVELNHIEIMHTVFLKLCLFERLAKKEYLHNYLLSILNITLMAIKEKKSLYVLDVLYRNIKNVIEVTKTIENFQADEKQDFKKITDSGTWQNFCKTVLKECLKIRTLDQKHTTEPQILSLLTILVKLFYPCDHEDIINLFGMVTSHSEFLDVMLSHHSPDIKLRLLEFLYVLISTNKSVMKAQQIPVYLSAYHATRDSCDRMLLSIIQFYEANGLPVNEYKPYIWGDSAANYYAVRKSRTTTLWGHPTPNQVMNLFHKDMIEKTVRYFPVNQKLEYNYIPDASISLRVFIDRTMRDTRTKNCRQTEEAINNLMLREESCKILATVKENDITLKAHQENEETIYDPAFLLPLLSHLLAPGSVASSFKLLRSSLLSVPVMALSSNCPLMRAAAYHILHRFHMLLETETRHKNDKLLLTDFITTLHHSLSTAINSPSTEGELKDMKNPKLPAIGALYLARALMISTSPSEPLYKPVNNFLIAKQFVDLTVIPDFLNLFHDNDVEAVERRHWVLDLIRDGTKTMTDVNAVFKTMCLKMIMDFYNTVLADKKTKIKIINALNSIIAIPRGFEILVEGYGFMSWLHFVVRNIGKDEIAIVKIMFVLIENMLYSMGLNLFSRYCGKFNVDGPLNGLTDFRIKTDLEYEILNIIYDLLAHIESLSVEDVMFYMKLYNLISRRSIKFLSKKQILNVVNKCSGRLENSESVKFIQQAVLLNNLVMLNSKTLAKDIVTEEDRLIRELKNFVQTYVG